VFFIQEHDSQLKILREMLPPDFGLRQPSGAIGNVCHVLKAAAALQNAGDFRQVYNSSNLRRHS
jgi:hypothetical protein